MADFGLYKALTVKDDFATKRQDAQFNLQNLQQQSAIQEKIMQENLLAQEQINKTFSELAALPYLPEDMQQIKNKMMEDKKFVAESIRNAGGDLRKFMMAGGSTILNNYKNGILTSKEVGDAKYNAVTQEMITKSKAEGYRPAHPLYSTYEELEQSRFAEDNPNKGRIDFRGNIKTIDYKSAVEFALRNTPQKKGAVSAEDYASMMITFNPMMQMPDGQNTKVVQDMIDRYNAGEPLYWGQGSTTTYDPQGRPIKPAKPGVPLSVPTFSGLKLDANGRVQNPKTQDVTPNVSPIKFSSNGQPAKMENKYIYKVFDEFSKESFQFGVVNMVSGDTEAFEDDFRKINGLISTNELRFANNNFVTLPTDQVDSYTPHLTLGAPDKLVNMTGDTKSDFEYQGQKQAPIMRVFTKDNTWKSPLWFGTVEQDGNLGTGYMGYENSLIAFADPSLLNKSGVTISDFSQADQELIKAGKHFYGYNETKDENPFYLSTTFGIATTEEGNYHFYSGPSYTSTNSNQISSNLMQQQSGANVQIRDSYNSGAAILNERILQNIPVNGNLGIRFQQ